ncbi:Peptidase S11, D-alanyl-D-alanine carboxypeptidase A [Syntrophomonas zehnderi OL-4]|uniref:serine-type D-Ala-D-Ala carboxypeptidase n=1 Tax=Syntrophomonas zehnderi OL-4 TaxID=690567 RepID=A0A0E4GDY3_9FIRM|nr:D-alanyl-D-alanine carboxypeptidase family protein [Syntrophomonas zehnderi]CFX68079.1 Peptidase S11, D-alanyl-D-alanine carboxypeptidase A [Syntrophomonas zehnderi OL-4]
MKDQIRVRAIRITGAILLALGLLLGLKPLPVWAAPSINSRYYCLVEGATGQPILAKNANQERPVASTTKIMTGILVLEYADLDEIATVSQFASRTPQYSIGLRRGQELSLHELMKASLIKSSNDAAVVLAEHIAGDEEFFGHLMSKKAFALGAMRTHFRNASGLPQEGHYSTPFDLARISRYTLTQPYLAKMVATRQSSFKHPGYLQPLTINNTNNLLGSYPGADGIKTGTANEAGKCLIASATRSGRQLIAVVLKSSDRSGDCARLLDYGFKQTARSQIIDSGEVFKNVKVSKGQAAYAEIMPRSDLWLWLGEDKADIEKRIRMNYLLEAPLAAGYKVGEMDVFMEGQYVETIDLVTRKDIPREPHPLKRIILKLLSRSGQ